MLIIKNTYYHTCGGGKNISILKDSLTKGVKPLIWFNKGIWGIISAEKIANIITNMEDQEKLPVIDRKKDVGKLYWDEVEIIPSKIAKLLFGE